MQVISLTSLVDVIFLLLIFFMLTSQIAPFSLISLTQSKVENDVHLATTLPDVSPDEATGPGALIIVVRGGILLNGQQIPLRDVDKALKLLRENGVDIAIISPRSGATVQDLVSVLEAVKSASFKSVSIRYSGGRG